MIHVVANTDADKDYWILIDSKEVCLLTDVATTSKKPESKLPN